MEGSKKITDYSILPFFELSSDLFCIAGFDGYLKRINPALCEVLGYTEEELLAQPINSFIHPDDLSTTEKQRERLRNNKSLVNFENRYITKNKEILWLSWDAKALPEKKLVYAIARNITHKKRHEAERNRLLSELTKSNSHLKQLNYATAHDLRSPLNSILSIFSLMDVNLIEDEETKEFVQLLETSSKNLKAKLDDYVDHQKRSSVDSSLVEVSILKTLKLVESSMENLIKKTLTSIQTDFAAFDVIKFNKTYLESIFLNLISNSIKYAHPDRNPIITIKSSINDGVKQLIYSDNGIGFDAKANKDRIFRFNQTFHNHSDSKGIGLYLVYNHVKNAGGDITVDSEVDHGATFTISFP